MTWKKTFPLKLLLWYESSIGIAANGNSMRLEAAFRVDWRRCVLIMELILKEIGGNKNVGKFAEGTENQSY